jgi:hypothetical protein
VFLVETWVYANGSESKIWRDGTSQSVKKRGLTTSTRYIILHAGTQNGFVSGASLIFIPGTKSGNYHNFMLKWKGKRFFPKNGGGSAIFT